MLSISNLICAEPGVTVLLIAILPHIYEWPNNFVLAAIFTALLFRGEFTEGGTRIFSKQNTRTMWEIIQIHSAFVAILFGLLWLTRYFDPSMPSWITGSFDSGGRPGSILDILTIIIMLGMHFIEYRWIYLEMGGVGSNKVK